MLFLFQPVLQLSHSHTSKTTNVLPTKFPSSHIMSTLTSAIFMNPNNPHWQQHSSSTHSAFCAVMLLAYLYMLSRFDMAMDDLPRLARRSGSFGFIVTRAEWRVIFVLIASWLHCGFKLMLLSACCYRASESRPQNRTIGQQQ